MFEQYLVGYSQKMALDVARNSYNSIFTHLIGIYGRQQSDQVDISSMISFIEDNNIVQILDIIRVCIDRKLPNITLNSIENTLVKEIQLEICTCKSLIERIYELKLKIESYWLMAQWRTGPVSGIYSDLVKSLKMIDIKFNLLNILSNIQ